MASAQAAAGCTRTCSSSGTKWVPGSAGSCISRRRGLEFMQREHAVTIPRDRVLVHPLRPREAAADRVHTLHTDEIADVERADLRLADRFDVHEFARLLPDPRLRLPTVQIQLLAGGAVTGNAVIISSVENLDVHTHPVVRPRGDPVGEEGG